jgi:ADP-heptose:LPS heptosyltransferase
MLSDSAMQFVALQKDVSLSELDFLAQNPFIITLDREQDDFADAAAIIANLDLVISVDTSVAHLAGALGKETWILLPKVCDWRWMVSRRDSPWYSSVRLFRQEIQGDWSSVVNEVKQELAERFSTSKVELK